MNDVIAGRWFIVVEKDSPDGYLGDAHDAPSGEIKMYASAAKARSVADSVGGDVREVRGILIRELVST